MGFSGGTTIGLWYMKNNTFEKMRTTDSPVKRKTSLTFYDERESRSTTVNLFNVNQSSVFSILFLNPIKRMNLPGVLSTQLIRLQRIAHEIRFENNLNCCKRYANVAVGSSTSSRGFTYIFSWLRRFQCSRTERPSFHCWSPEVSKAPLRRSSVCPASIMVRWLATPGTSQGLSWLRAN